MSNGRRQADRKKPETNLKEMVVDGSSSIGAEVLKVPLEEKRLLRGLDVRILPITFLLYSFVREFSSM